MIKPYLFTQMPDGSVWITPTGVITNHFIKREMANGKTEEEANQSMADWFEDDYEVIDYAKNNMNWADVAKDSKLVIKPDPDFEHGWANGKAMLSNSLDIDDKGFDYFFDDE